MSPLFRANGIRPEAKSWQSLANTEHEFPWAPRAGSVDASVLLFLERNPADLTKLSFGDIADGKIRARFSIEVDFEVESDRDDLGQVAMELDLELVAMPLRVATSVEKRLKGDPDAITNEVKGIVDLSQYGAVEKVPGGFEFPVL